MVRTIFDFPKDGGYIMVSLCDLILYTVCKKACIYNPTTKQSLTLSTIKSNIFAKQEPNKHVNYFFRHDHVHDQYIIVCGILERSCKDNHRLLGLRTRTCKFLEKN